MVKLVSERAVRSFIILPVPVVANSSQSERTLNQQSLLSPSSPTLRTPAPRSNPAPNQRYSNQLTLTPLPGPPKPSLRVFPRPPLLKEPCLPHPRKCPPPIPTFRECVLLVLVCLRESRETRL